MNTITVTATSVQSRLKFNNFRYVQDIPIGGIDAQGDAESSSLILSSDSPIDIGVQYQVGIFSPHEAGIEPTKNYVHNETVYRKVLGRGLKCGLFNPVRLAPIELLMGLPSTKEELGISDRKLKYIVALGSLHDTTEKTSCVAAMQISARRKFKSVSCMTHWASPHAADQVAYLVY